MKFSVTLERDEDGVWVVECPSIPGCFSQGKTKAEALKNVRDAIQGCFGSSGRNGLSVNGGNTTGRGFDLMPRPPVLNGRKVQKVFERLGWEFQRQTGSHLIMTKPGEILTLSIPNHNPVALGTLRGLIRTAGLTVEEFNEVCK